MTEDTETQSSVDTEEDEEISTEAVQYRSGDHYSIGSSIRTAHWYDPLDQLRVASMNLDGTDSLYLENALSGERLTIDESLALSEISSAVFNPMQADLDANGHSISNLGSVDTDELQHSDVEGLAQSLWANLTAGRPVAISNTLGLKSVSFSDYATDDAALQTLADWAIAEDTGYELHVPGFTESGGVVTIENTVQLNDGRRVEAYFYCTGFDKRRAIQSTIDDGSHCFEIHGGNTPVFEGGVFRGDGGNDSTVTNNCGLVRIIDASDFIVRPRRIEWMGGSNITVDSGNYGWLIDDVRIRPDDTSAVPIELVNDYSSNASDTPGYGKIGQNVTVDNDCDVAIRLRGDDAKPIHISGHYEQSNGTALIDIGSNHGAVVGPDTTLGVTYNGSGGIYSEGELFVQGCRFAGAIDGTGVHVASNADWLSISPTTRFGDTIDAITIDAAVGNPGVIPYPHQVGGNVTYPTEFGSLTYPDGWQPETYGTEVITGGTTNWVFNSGGPSTQERKLLTWPTDNVHSSDAAWQVVYGTYSGGDRFRFGIEEKEGTDIEMNWVVMKRLTTVPWL